MAVAKQSPFESVTINLEHDIDEQYQYQPGEIIRGKIGKCFTLTIINHSWKNWKMFYTNNN
jgi:hypothetical protein